MKVSQYYAIHGRDNPVQNLVHAHNELKSFIKENTSSNQFKEYLQTLNDISYNQEKYNASFFGSAKDGINKAVEKRYKAIVDIGNHIANGAFNVSGIELDKPYSYIIGNSVKRCESALKNKSHSATGAMYKRTFERYYNEWLNLKNLINKAGKSGDAIALQNGCLRYSDFKKKIDNYINEVLQGEYHVEEGDNSYRFTKGSSLDELKLGKSLIFWVNFLSAAPGNQEKGDVSESFAQLARDITVEGEKAAFNKGMNKIKKEMKEGLKGTSRTGKSSNNLFSAIIDWNSGFQLNDMEVMGDRNYKFNESFTVDGFTYKFNVDYQTDKDRQIKADIVISDDLKVSVKNWGDWTFIDDMGKTRFHDLGSTYILNAVLRTTNNNILEDYMYAIQDNQLRESDDGSNAVNVAHDLAKLSLLMDIASGYSQRNIGGNANYLIINNRKERKWIGIDLYDLINKSIMKSRTKDGFSIELSGYDDQKLSNIAWSIMSALMRSNKGKMVNSKISNISSMYYNMLVQRLHHEKITALFKNI